MKRTFDIVFALTALFFAAPLMVVIAILVRRSSPGPIVFRQPRTGLGGKPFTIYKFRTMRDGSGRPCDLVLEGDPRVTRVGRVLRGFYLDELPQLINILRGDMSIIGPRPRPVPIFIQHGASVWYWRMLTIRPGLTGLSQILGRNRLIANGAEYAFRIDAYYARSRSWLLDLRILLCTVGMVLGRRGI